MLTIAYLTSRKEPMFEWFAQSLHRETGGDYTGIRILIVDHWFEERANVWTTAHTLNRYGEMIKDGGGVALHGPPKPTVWQGKHRLTKEDWFAASNSRNTALCHAPDGHIAYVDDLSVLSPGWLKCVREAMARGSVTCGAYRKVRDLVVSATGDIVSFTDFPGGHDNRYGGGSDSGPVHCGGNWLYGCSLVAPVEALLEINGWPEICDGLGFEDCITGIMLEKKGWAIEYDRRMMTYEAEELHHVGPVMKRSDYGVSPNDKSHAVLKMAQQGDGWHPGYFGEEGIRGLRQRVLRGEPFPIVQVPQHEWFTGTPLSEL